MPAITSRDDVALYGSALAEFVGGLPYLNRVRPGGTLPVFRNSGEGVIGFQGRYLMTLVTRLASFCLGNIRIPELFSLKKPSELTLVWKSVMSVGRLGCTVNIK